MNRLIILFLWAFLGGVFSANAQSPAGITFLNANGGRTTVGIANPLPVTGGGGGGAVTCALCALESTQQLVLTAVQGSVPAGANLIGDVNLRQGGTALSATNGIFTNLLQGNVALSATNPLPTLHVGTGYETVAASQTAQVLGGSGATGDYLSHCVIYPTSTSPGVVTVFDNANAAGTNAIAFPGGATSLSNLAPIAIPVGAISTAGPWKVTTGGNLIVTCYGRFT